MLLLQINHKPADTQGVSFSLVLKSAIEFGDSQEGSFVFNTKLPATDRNNALFGFPQRITRLEMEAINLPARISFNSRTFAEGTAMVEQATNRWIEIAIVLANGEFNSQAKIYNLTDLVTDTVSIGTTVAARIAHANSLVTKQYPEINHVFATLKNSLFYKNEDQDIGYNQDYAGIVNDYTDDSYVSNWPVEGEALNKTTLVPFLFLHHIIKSIYNNLGYTVTGKFLNDPELQQLLVYNNRSIDNKEPRYSYGGRITSKSYYGSASPIIIKVDEGVWNYDNSFNSSDGKFTIQEDGSHKCFMDLQIKALAGYSGTLWATIRIMHEGDELSSYSHEISDTEWTDVNRVISEFYADASFGSKIWFDVQVENQAAPPEEAQWADFTLQNVTLSVTNVSQSRLNRFASVINYADHVPDLLASEFLHEIYKLFALVPFYDHRQRSCELIFLKDILNQASSVAFSENIEAETYLVKGNEYEGLKFDFTFSGKDENTKDNFVIPEVFTEVDTYGEIPLLPALNDVFYVKTLNAFYIYTVNEDDETLYFKLKSDNFAEQVYDNGKKEIVPKLSPVLMRQDVAFDAILPSVEQAGNSPAFDTAANAFDLALFFWRGLHAGAPGQVYPLATPYEFNDQGNTVGNYSLRWDGPSGLIVNFWQPVIDWYKRRLPVEFKKQMTETELEQLLFQKLHRTFDVNVILQEITVEISDLKIKQAEVKGYLQ
jgi:hypothetical protein